VTSLYKSVSQSTATFVQFVCLASCYCSVAVFSTLQLLQYFMFFYIPILSPVLAISFFSCNCANEMMTMMKAVIVLTVRSDFCSADYWNNVAARCIASQAKHSCTGHNNIERFVHTGAAAAALTTHVCPSRTTQRLRYIKTVVVITERRSEERWMFSAASVCLCVCQHDNFRTSKRRMMISKCKSGKCIVHKSRPSSNLGVIAPLGAPPPPKKKCGVGLRRWENQRRLSITSSLFCVFETGCISKLHNFCIHCAPKKVNHQLMAMILSKSNRFSKFFL